MMLVFLLFFVLPLAVTVVRQLLGLHRILDRAGLHAAQLCRGVRRLPDLTARPVHHLQDLSVDPEDRGDGVGDHPDAGLHIAYFLVFHIRTMAMQVVLCLLCTIPFWTSNVIRMISWIPLLGRNGLVNQSLIGLGIIGSRSTGCSIPNSRSCCLRPPVHVFMIVPILNSMLRIDPVPLIEAATDAGASGWQTLWNVIVPLSKPGIVIGSIFVITIVNGRFRHRRRHGRAADRLGRQGDPGAAQLFAVPGRGGQCRHPLGRGDHDHRGPDPAGRHPQGAVMREGRPASFYFLAAVFALFCCSCTGRR